MLKQLVILLFALNIIIASPLLAIPIAFQASDVRIEVDTKQQQVRVYMNGAIIREMPCSTGKPETPTPTGSFKIHKRISAAEVYVDQQPISFYFVSHFNGGIGFHSQLFGDHPLVRQGKQRFKERLPSSLGCVRLQIADAHWIYENIPLGVSVDVL